MQGGAKLNIALLHARGSYPNDSRSSKRVVRCPQCPFNGGERICFYSYIKTLGICGFRPILKELDFQEWTGAPPGGGTSEKPRAHTRIHTHDETEQSRAGQSRTGEAFTPCRCLLRRVVSVQNRNVSNRGLELCVVPSIDYAQELK